MLQRLPRRSEVVAERVEYAGSANAFAALSSIRIAAMRAAGLELPLIASSAYWNVRIGVARRRIRQAVGIERIGPLFLELGDEVHAHCLLGLQAASAVPARHELRISAAAIVDGDLRIRAHRPAAERRVRRCDRIGRIAALDPVHHHVEQVLRLRSNAAAAMRDAWRKEEAEPRRQVLVSL